MGVGPIRGGGKSGGPKGPKGAGAKGAVKGGTFGKTDRTEKLVGASGAAGTSEAGAVGGDVVVAQANEIARALKSGQIKTKAEAAKMLVAGILREKMKMQSKALEAKIAEQLSEDPRLAQTLERIWQRGQQ